MNATCRSGTSSSPHITASLSRWRGRLRYGNFKRHTPSDNTNLPDTRQENQRRFMAGGAAPWKRI